MGVGRSDLIIAQALYYYFSCLPNTLLIIACVFVLSYYSINSIVVVDIIMHAHGWVDWMGSGLLYSNNKHMVYGWK